MTIPVNFGQASLVWGSTAAPLGAVSTYGFAHDGTNTADEVAQALVDTWEADWFANVSSSLSLVRIDVKFGPDATGSSGTAPSGAVGAGVALAVTPQVAWLCRKTTALGGRQGRGRMFLPGLEEGNVNSSGNIDSTVLSNAQTDMDELLAAHTVLDLDIHLLHGDALAPTPVTGLILQSQVATQRRRNRR